MFIYYCAGYNTYWSKHGKVPNSLQKGEQAMSVPQNAWHTGDRCYFIVEMSSLLFYNIENSKKNKEKYWIELLSMCSCLSVLVSHSFTVVLFSLFSFNSSLKEVCILITLRLGLLVMTNVTE